MRFDCFVVTLVGITLSISTKAEDYNPLRNFSSLNPDGPWTYGTGVTGKSFTPMTRFSANSCLGFSGLQCWQPSTAIPGDPLIARNNSPSDIFIQNGFLAGGPLDLHPGRSVDTVVQWTAPMDGIYSIFGYFEQDDFSPSGTFGLVYRNADQIYSAFLLGPPATNTQPPSVGGNNYFRLYATVNTGDVISFGLNNPGSLHGDWIDFDTRIARVGAVPEPHPVVLLAIGLSACFVLGRKRVKFPALNPSSATDRL